MPVVGTSIDIEGAKTKGAADDIARDFEAQARRRGVSAQLRRIACEALEAPAIAAAAARLFDLAILPLAPGSRASRELAEAVIFGAGRPCLLLPPNWGVEPTLFDRALVAWDASRAATRALGDGLPLLQRANAVFVIAVGSQTSVAARTLADVERWLADHDVRAQCALVDGGGGSAAAAIEEHARRVRANLLVMGAFGHSRMRDFILGGVTRTALAEPKFMVLFSH